MTAPSSPEEHEALVAELRPSMDRDVLFAWAVDARSRMIKQAAEIGRLRAMVYVPGLWQCPKCKFSLIQGTINARDGTVSGRDQPGEKCPNCNTPLWRVSERDAGNEQVDRAIEQRERAKAAEAERDSLQARVAELEASTVARPMGGAEEVDETFSIARNVGDKRFLTWLADRLVHVYGEPENVDFVHTLRRFAEAFEPPSKLAEEVQVSARGEAGVQPAAPSSAHQRAEEIICTCGAVGSGEGHTSRCQWVGSEWKKWGDAFDEVGGLRSSVVASGNYVSDQVERPTYVEFANGRSVRAVEDANGPFLLVGKVDASPPAIRALPINDEEGT